MIMESRWSNRCVKSGVKYGQYYFLTEISPQKGHILSFVLPQIIKEHRTFFRFYKLEEKGESIHAIMNDINRKCWVIKNKEARLWKIIERYELRNVTNVNITAPLKRTLKRNAKS